ncbi:MAG: hypothetical protein KC646_16990 [Candidatus Cloacimonetes bacterium]|nr:hypothetical protein [Candidatus Cloacimonadota bacterium]
MRVLILFTLVVSKLFCESNVYINDDLGFSIQKASNKQTFLFHDQIQQIHPKALIGVIDESKEFYSFLLIKPSSKSTLQEFSKKIVDQIEISNIELNNYKDYDHQGLKAVSFNLNGYKNGHNIRYEVNLIKNGTNIIQLYSVLIDQDAQNLKFTSLKPQLTLHNQDVVYSPKLSTTKDWLIAKNKYYNQSNGFFIDLNIENFKRENCSSGIICLNNSKDKQYLLIQAYPKDIDVNQEFLNNFDISYKKQEFLTNKPSNKIYLIKNKSDKVFYHLFEKQNDQTKVLLVFKSNSYLDHRGFDSLLDKHFGWIKNKGLHQITQILDNKSNKTLVQDKFQNFYKNQYRNFKAGVEINFPKKQKVKFELTKSVKDHLYSEFYINNLSKNYTLEVQIQKYNSQSTELNLHKHILKKLNPIKYDKLVTFEYLGLYYTQIEINNSLFYILTRKHYDSLFYGIYKGSTENLNQLLNHFHFLELKEVQITKDVYKSHKYQFSFSKKKYLVQELASNQKDLLQIEIKNKFQTHIMYIGPKHKYSKEKILKIHGDDHKIFGLNELSSAKKSYLSYPYDYDQYSVTYPNENLRLVQQTLNRENLVFSVITTGNENVLGESFIHHHNLNLNNTFTR